MSREREIKNARIESTMLGTEDHGIFTAYVMLDYGGSGQGFGGYALDTWVGPRDGTGARRGTAYGMQWVIEVCRVVGVTKWEDLKGKHVRVDADFGKIYRIGHIIKDVWFDPAQLLTEEKELADA